MKTLMSIISLAALITLSSCTTAYVAAYEDDVYSYQPQYRKAAPVVASSIDQDRDYTVSSAQNDRDRQDDRDFSDQQNYYNDKDFDPYADDEDAIVYDESTYYEDEPYDYSYSARIKRFHNPIDGCGYYDSYYTNRYWYDYDPFSWGSSIYIVAGSPFPYYSPSAHFYWSYNWGWSSPYWGWGYGYSPYYWGWGYHHYPHYLGWGLGSIYWAGYWDGYHDSFYYPGGYYHNPKDVNGYYYGHRGDGNTFGLNPGNNTRSDISMNNARPHSSTVSGSNGNNATRVNGRNRSQAMASSDGFFSRNRSTTQSATKRESRSVNNNRSTSTSSATNRHRNTNAINNSSRSTRYSNAGNTRSSRNANTGTRSKYNYKRNRSNSQGHSNSRYNRPSSTRKNINTRSNRRNYQSGNRSSRYQNPSGTRNTRRYTAPKTRRQNKNTIRPRSGSSSHGRSYSAPQRSSSSSSRSYSTPSRSYSSPSSGSSRSSGGSRSGGSSRGRRL